MRKHESALVGPYLSHSLEEGPGQALLVRQTDLGYEQRTGGEHKVRTEHGHDRSREAEGPVGRVHVDDRKEEVGNCSQGCARDCSRHQSCCRLWRAKVKYAPMRKTTSMRPTTSAMMKLQTQPVTNMGIKRTMVNTGVRRRKF